VPVFYLTLPTLVTYQRLSGPAKHGKPKPNMTAGFNLAEL